MGTHFLETADVEISQNTEKSDREMSTHFLEVASGERSRRNKSGHGKKSEQAKGTHFLGITGKK